jgi:hypothetical protein
MILKLEDEVEEVKEKWAAKKVNWGNKYNSNSFFIFGMLEQGSYIEINGNKMAVLEFEHFYLKMNIKEKKITIYEKEGFNEEMLEDPDYKKMIKRLITYAKKESIKTVFTH